MFSLAAGRQDFREYTAEEQSGSEPLNRINRALSVRSRRLVIGVAIDRDFMQIQGALLAATGHGKHMRVDFVSESAVAIPPAIGQHFRSLLMNKEIDLTSLASAAADLGEIQAIATRKLTTQAGKYLDRILAVAVTDPGIHGHDFDGQPIQLSISNPAIIAERSGLNVIDAFPAQDIQVGGDGSTLEALPLWLFLADRSRKVSRIDRILVDLDSGPTPTLYYIPASDGKDNDVPNLKVMYYDGQRFVPKSFGRLPLKFDAHADRAAGKPVFNIESTADCRQLLAATNQCIDTISGGLPVQLLWFAGGRQTAELDQIRDGEKTGSPQSTQSTQPFSKIDGSSRQQPLTADESIERSVPLTRWLTWADHPVQSLSAITTGLLGLMHIDQMPANLPWLTGGSKLRILGRLTPGRPTSWRNLIRTMADLHPPIMKLKDAV